MLFVLVPRSGEGRSDIVVAEVKDRKFREEASSGPMPAAIIEEDRTNATDVYDKDDVYARGRDGVPLSGGDPEQIPKRGSRSDPRPNGARNTSNFFASLRPPEKGVSATADSTEYLSIGRGLPRRSRDHRT